MHVGFAHLLGRRAEEPGADREMAIDIARQVQRCHRAVCDALECDGDQPVASFLLRRPGWRGIVRRVQTMGGCSYGDIRANILHHGIEVLESAWTSLKAMARSILVEASEASRQRGAGEITCPGKTPDSADKIPILVYK